MAIAATLAVVAGLVLANMLGVAAAEAPTTATPTPTVSVEGVATVPIAQDASLAAATAAYREGMAAAVADGHTKAEFLSGKAGTTLGSVQSIVEGGGYIGCRGYGEEESGYAQYQGEQPDFGSAESVSPVRAAAAKPATPVRPKIKKKKKKGPSAGKAAATTCTLSTQVSLVYAIS
jgi:hypothetical protein